MHSHTLYTHTWEAGLQSSFAEPASLGLLSPQTEPFIIEALFPLMEFLHHYQINQRAAALKRCSSSTSSLASQVNALIPPPQVAPLAVLTTCVAQPGCGAAWQHAIILPAVQCIPPCRRARSALIRVVRFGSYSDACPPRCAVLPAVLRVAEHKPHLARVGDPELRL